MNVYIVMENQYEWARVDKVFQSREDAINYCNTQNEKLARTKRTSMTLNYSISIKEVM